MEIERYALWSGHLCADEGGRWAKYEQHALVVDTLHKRIRELEAKIIQLNDILEFDLDDYK